jgi:hypothetical protein
MRHKTRCSTEHPAHRVKVGKFAAFLYGTFSGRQFTNLRFSVNRLSIEQHRRLLRLMSEVRLGDKYSRHFYSGKQFLWSCFWTLTLHPRMAKKCGGYRAMGEYALSHVRTMGLRPQSLSHFMAISILQGSSCSLCVADSSATIIRYTALDQFCVPDDRCIRYKEWPGCREPLVQEMIRSLSVLILALSVAFAAGQNPPLGQCGGIDYAGPTGSLNRNPTSPLMPIALSG